MGTQYKTILYGGKAGIDVDKADIAAISTEVGNYLKKKDLQAQGIKLPGLKDAQKMVDSARKELKSAMKSKTAQEMGTSPTLKVIGGIDTKGNLSATVFGILSPPKSGKPPANFDKTVIIRKDWGKLEQELESDRNAVVNLTKDWSKIEEALQALAVRHRGDLGKIKSDPAFKSLVARYKGDDVINRAADKQAKLFKTTEQRKDEADFGGITKGTVVLAAHGSRVEASGITLGTKLGKMTPEQIVAFLTEQKDPKKNLSKDFNGTVLLSGCFTAAGGIAPPDSNYDYDTFAGKVWKLLKAKGIKCKVSGMPGQARTGSDGKKSSVIPTQQKEYDQLKKEVKELESAISKLQQKLNSGDENTKQVINKKVKALTKRLKEASAEKELKVMRELVNSYGLDPLR